MCPGREKSEKHSRNSTSETSQQRPKRRKQCSTSPGNSVIRRPPQENRFQETVCRKIAVQETPSKENRSQETRSQENQRYNRSYAFPETTGIIREITVHTKDLTRPVRRSVHMGTTIITITTIVTALRQLPQFRFSRLGPQQLLSARLILPRIQTYGQNPECGQPGACGKTGIQK